MDNLEVGILHSDRIGYWNCCSGSDFDSGSDSGIDIATTAIIPVLDDSSTRYSMAQVQEPSMA